MADQLAKIRPLSAIICDDIRKEQSLKETFIGVYTGDIVIHSIPTNLVLSTHIIFETAGIGKCPFEIQIATLDKTTQVTATGGVELIRASMRHQHLGITLPKFPVTFTGATQLIVRFRRQKGDRWKVFRTLDVIDKSKEAAAENVGIIADASSEP